jgi:hypothetical protein
LLPAASRPGGPSPSTPPARLRGGHDPATAHLQPTFSHRVPNAEIRSRVPSGCAVRIAAADSLLTSSPSGPLAHAFSTPAGDFGAARRHDPERAARTSSGKPQPGGRSALHLHHWPAGAVTSVTTARAPAARALAHHAMTWSRLWQSASLGPSGAPQRVPGSSRSLMASRSPDSKANLTRSVSAAGSWVALASSGMRISLALHSWPFQRRCAGHPSGEPSRGQPGPRIAICHASRQRSHRRDRRIGCLTSCAIRAGHRARITHE